MTAVTPQNARALLRRAELQRLLDDERQAGPVAASLLARVAAWRSAGRAAVAEVLLQVRRQELRRGRTADAAPSTRAT